MCNKRTAINGSRGSSLIQVARASSPFMGCPEKISVAPLCQCATFEVLEGSRCGTSATTTTFAARAAIANAHHRHPMAALWGDGTTSSSDGQYFRAGGRAGPGGVINAKYGIDPGAVLYTHVSGQYGPFHTKVLAATMSEAPYVLDGLHHHVHQTDLRIAEHYTDTAGATDHVFGFCHLLVFRFAPRIKDLKERKLYTIDKPSRYP